MQNILPFLIPIIAIVMSLGVLMLALYLPYRKQKEIYTLYHQERMAAMEKGIDLAPMPGGFLGETPRRRRDLLKGLLWLFVGLALTVAIYAQGKHKDALFALVPVG